MPNKSQTPQPAMPGSYSGFEVVPSDEVVLYEQLRGQETNIQSPEVFPTPEAPQTRRIVQGGLPLSVVAQESQVAISVDAEVANRARHVSSVVRDLRHQAVDQTMRQQGLRHAA